MAAIQKRLGSTKASGLQVRDSKGLALLLKDWDNVSINSLTDALIFTCIANFHPGFTEDPHENSGRLCLATQGTHWN